MSGKKENIVYLPVLEKNNFIPELPKERVDIIYLCFPNNPTGMAISKEELKKFVDYAKENNLHIAIRGLRAVTDFEYELQIAQTNKELSNGSLDTVFLTTSLEYSYLSSSAVKEIAAFNGDISKFVTPEVCKLLKEKYKR